MTGKPVDDPARRLVVREASEADWPAIWPFWSTIVADGETYAYPEGLGPDDARPLWFEPAPMQVLVAVDGEGEVLGSAKYGPNRPGRGDHVATASFMVASAACGRGVGRLLAEAVLARAQAAGFAAMQFNAVVETNTGAVDLWRTLGFEIIGTVPQAFRSARHGLVGLHVMYRRL